MILEKIRNIYYTWGLYLGILVLDSGFHAFWTTHPLGGYHTDTVSLSAYVAIILGIVILLSIRNNQENYFVTETRKSDFYLENIFDNAKRYIIIVSPFQ